MSLSAARGIPTTVEACIEVVNEGLAHRLGDRALPQEIENIVSSEVERLWTNPIKTFIPVLVTRAAWDALSSMRGSQAEPPRMNAPATSVRRDSDTLVFGPSDRLTYDRRDTLVRNERDTLLPD